VHADQKVALIVGVTGQDGAYLSHHLIGEGYKVVGTTRDIASANISRLKAVGVEERVEMITVLPHDFRSISKAVLNINPDEIYNLAGQTSVGLSFEQPTEAIDSIANATVNWLEAIRLLSPKTPFFNAGSSECFGDSRGAEADEQTSFSPRSPYAIAKASAIWYVKNYRESYGLKCCTGIMSNHESPLRGKRFVTQKIVTAVKEIRDGVRADLELGNLNVWRDWGWSADYARAIHLMLTQNYSFEDFVIATGESHSLNEFVELVFTCAGLNSRDFVRVSDNLLRPNELEYSALNPKRIKEVLDWESKIQFPEIVNRLWQNRLF
jgi:GDPmannose 4,6-dehydratase